MNSERKIEPEKIHILNIRTIKGNIDGDTDNVTDAIFEYRFSFEVGTGINVPDRVFGINLVVNIAAMDSKEQPLNISGSYTHEIIFRVDNLDDFVETTDDNGTLSYKTDAMMATTLLSIAYSTIRGIIFTRTQGTSLGTVILPVVDPKALMEIE